MCALQRFFLLMKTKTITSNQNSVVLWHFLVLINSCRYEMLMSVCFTCLCYSTHHKLLRWHLYWYLQN